MVACWVEWARDFVEGWPDDVRAAPFDTDAGEESVRRGASVATILHATEDGRR